MTAADSEGPSPLVVALTGARLRRSLVVMLAVGAVLNAINQGDAILAGGPIDWPKILLTFCVPFCVATYGAWSALAERDD